MAGSSSLPSASDDAFPVFIDSSLETGLSMTVSSSDTVASFKRIIEREHAVTYPEIGDVIVKAIKVKRRGSFYRLIDPMHVIKAFEGLQGPFFLQIEAVRAPQQISTDQNVEKNNFENLEGKISEQNVVVDKLQTSSKIGGLMENNLPSLKEKEALLDFSPNPPPVQEALSGPNPVGKLQNEKDGSNPSESHSLANPGAQIEPKTLNPNSAANQETNPSEKKRKKRITTTSENPSLKETDSRNENNTRIEENSVHEKQEMLSENLIPDSVESKKGKSRKVIPDKKNLTDGKSREKRRRKDTVPDKNLITEANSNTGIENRVKVNQEGEKTGNPNQESNQDSEKTENPLPDSHQGGKTEHLNPDSNQDGTNTGNPIPKSNQDAAKTENPNPESNQDVGTGTGTETKKVKPRKGVTKKSQVSQEATQKTEELVIASQKKKTKREKVSKAPAVTHDNPVLERDSEMPENSGAINSLAPKEAILNEINTEINVGSPKKAPTDKTVSSKGLVSPHKTRPKKSQATTADVASKNDDVASKNDDVASKNDDVATKNDDVASKNVDMATKNDDVASKEAGQIISSVITDLKEQETEANKNTESETLIDAELATNLPSPNPELKPKTKPKFKIPTVDKNETSKNSLIGNQDEKKKRKMGKVFAPPLLSENENNRENNEKITSKFETLVFAASSQQEKEGKETKLDSNLIEDPNKQDKKKKRRKNEAKSTVEKKSNETVNNTQIDAIKSSEIQKPQKKKPSKAKSKDQSANTEKSEGENSKNVTTAETRVHKINFIDHFSPDEPKESKEAKKRNPNLVDDMAYLSDESTEDENEYRIEAKRYKVAVRKVPVKRKTEASRKSSDIASESTKDEGSFMSDSTTNMQKGFGGKENSVDDVVMSQESSGTKKNSEGKDKIAQERQSVDIVFETEEQDLTL